VGFFQRLAVRRFGTVDQLGEDLRQQVVAVDPASSVSRRLPIEQAAIWALRSPNKVSAGARSGAAS